MYPTIPFSTHRCIPQFYSPLFPDVSLVVPDVLDLTSFKGQGRQTGEDEFPPDDRPDAAATPEVVLDEGVISQLMDMGFGMESCKRVRGVVLLTTHSITTHSITTHYSLYHYSLYHYSLSLLTLSLLTLSLLTLSLLTLSLLTLSLLTLSLFTLSLLTLSLLTPSLLTLPLLTTYVMFKDCLLLNRRFSTQRILVPSQQ